MLNQFSRTELLIGKNGIDKLKNAKIAVFGIGGVGSYVVESLARAGVGNFIIVDNDDVSITNINRQIIATHKTIGKAKVDVMKERILDINPEASVVVYKEFFLPGSNSDIITDELSYVADCVDTVTAKIEIIVQSKQKGVPVISSMGTGNKLNPTMFEIADISKTSVCPLAKVMRKELKNRNIKNVKVLYSKEEPINVLPENEYDFKEESKNNKKVPGSISYVPSVAGLIIAGEIINDIINNNS